VSYAESFLTRSLTDSVPGEQRSELHQQQHDQQQRLKNQQHQQAQQQTQELEQQRQYQNQYQQHLQDQHEIDLQTDSLDQQQAQSQHRLFRQDSEQCQERGKVVAGLPMRSSLQPADGLRSARSLQPNLEVIPQALRASNDNLSGITGSTVVVPSNSFRGTGNDHMHEGNLDSASSKQMLSHTKLCRDRLNSMFERLRDTLPPPPPGTDIKHKAQVLDYACAVLKDMVERTAMLEAELALSSMRSTNAWANRTVEESPSFITAASKVMSLFCLHREWTMAELWISSQGPHASSAGSAGSGAVAGSCLAGSDGFTNSRPPGATSSDGRDVGSLHLGSCLFRDPGVVTRDAGLAAFVATARAHILSPDVGIIGRAWSSMRPDWVTGINNRQIFVRSKEASLAGLQTCFALPIAVGGRVEAVVVFYDKKHRAQDNTCLEVAMRLTWALGNAVGAKRASSLQPEQDERASQSA
jgi:hypothetical protein